MGPGNWPQVVRVGSWYFYLLRCLISSSPYFFCLFVSSQECCQSVLSPCILRQGLSLNPNLTSWIAGLAGLTSEPQTSPSPPPWLPLCVLGLRLRHSGLHDKHFTDKAISKLLYVGLSVYLVLSFWLMMGKDKNKAKSIYKNMYNNARSQVNIWAS